jgi:cell division protein FtsB
MYLKKTIVKAFLLSELILFTYLYLFGTNGIKSLKNQEVIIGGLMQELHQYEKEIGELEKEITIWKTDEFYKEKIAREQLQMARKDDKLFYIGT